MVLQADHSKRNLRTNLQFIINEDPEYKDAKTEMQALLGSDGDSDDDHDVVSINYGEYFGYQGINFKYRLWASL